MNVEIGTVAKQFPEKEYLFRIFAIGSLKCIPELPATCPCSSSLNYSWGSRAPHALVILPEVQVHVEHNEELQLSGQSSVVEWSDVE